MKRIITLTTDFGMSDHYVGSMKGVILDINPEAVITDITHGLPKYDIFKAAYTLGSFYKYFSKDTIHIVVVDPGVGSARKPIAIKSEHGTFIGPDNGLFSIVLENSKNVNIYEITNSEYMLENVSNTFHARDIFAPAAAYISLGIDISQMGEKVNSPILLDINKPIINDNEIIGEVVYTDSFGNLVTNVASYMVGVPREICIGGFVIDTVAKSYQDVEKGKLLAIIGSSGFLEISVNEGSAEELIKDRKIIIRK